MSETPRPYFWIRRNGNTYVPLIPVDELPSWIGIRGVSTTKDWNNVCQGEMRFLGDHDDHNGSFFVVDVFGSADEGSSESESSLATPTEKALTEPDNKEDKAHNTEKTEIGVDQVQANIDEITSGQDGRPDESPHSSQQDAPKYQGTAGTLGKKVYCTYWIRTGNCNYMQEGCKYKHEIPPDDETRLAIGVRTYPTWPREDPVCNPRPPPVKAPPLQKPALQQSWRRAATVPAKGEPNGAQKTSQRPKPRKSSDPGTGPTVHGSTHTKSSPVSSVPSSDFRQPAEKHSSSAPLIAAANAAQHFPSHAQAGTPVLVHGNGRQPPTTATATDSSNGRSAHTKLLLRNPLPAKPITGGQNHSPFALSPQTPMAQPQGNNNPFTQRVPSKNHARLVGNATPFDGPYKSPYVSGPGAGSAPFQHHPPPYMPILSSSGVIGSPRAHTPAVMHGNTSSSTGEASDGHNGNSDVGSNGTSNVFANSQSTAAINTPASSDNTINASLDGNAATDLSASAPPRSSTRAFMPTTVNRKAFSNSTGNTSFSFGRNDPAIVSVRTQTPLSINGRGPVLFNPHAQSEFRSSPAVSEKGDNKDNNPFSGRQPASFSPPPVHRRMFRAPGEAEFVANPLEEAHSKSNRTTKKHVSGNSSAKGKKSGSAGKHHHQSQDLLV